MTATSMFFQTKSAVPVAVEYPSISEAQVTDIAIDNTQGKSCNVETDPTQTTTTEVDVESSTSEESVTPHSEFVPVEASSTESDEGSEEDEDSDRRTILVDGKLPQDQIKFIVFEEAILDVFGKCGQCGSKCIVTMKNQIGSSCKICSSCTTQNEHYFEWTTGPSVFKMPAFLSQQEWNQRKFFDSSMR